MNILLKRSNIQDKYSIVAITCPKLLKFTPVFLNFKNHPQKAHQNNIANHYLLQLQFINTKETTSRPLDIYNALFPFSKKKKEKIISNYPTYTIILEPLIISKAISVPAWPHIGKAWQLFSAKKVKVPLTVPLYLPILDLSTKLTAIFTKQQYTTKNPCKYATNTT